MTSRADELLEKYDLAVKMTGEANELWKNFESLSEAERVSIINKIFCKYTECDVWSYHCPGCGDLRIDGGGGGDEVCIECGGEFCYDCSRDCFSVSAELCQSCARRVCECPDKVCNLCYKSRDIKG